MSDVLPIRFGTDSGLPPGSQAFDNLWLPVFGGEVLMRFEENNLMRPLVDTRSISSGNQMKFPRMWRFQAERHAAGAEMLGLPTDFSEITITLDDRPIVAHKWLDDIDQKMSHFEVRSGLAMELGRALAREVDKNIAILLVQTSRTAAPANGPFPGGGDDEAGAAYIDAALAADSVPSSATSRAAAGALLKAIDSAVVKFEDRDIPMEDRVCVVKPKLWHALRVFGIPITEGEMYGAGATSGPFWQQPGLNGPGGSQNPRRDSFLNYSDVHIYRSPNIPTTNITTGESKYQGDYTNTEGVIFQKQAFGYLELMGVKTETERSARHQADFMVVSTLAGGGAVRPQAAIELATA